MYSVCALMQVLLLLDGHVFPVQCSTFGAHEREGYVAIGRCVPGPGWSRYDVTIGSCDVLLGAWQEVKGSKLVNEADDSMVHCRARGKYICQLSWNSRDSPRFGSSVLGPARKS